ncbi:MAG TPA: serine/threonine-protein kinase [Thermoanaerobaculia bacterium]|nr:serine/threonine-protein kinase [Thermoanaerobaculia bacterium]
MKTGQQVRDYILEKKIGEGGMGEVWSAVHSVLGRRVAIKVMAPHVAADREFGERFLQEARAQATLQHPRILGVTDFFAEGGVYYLVMPLVEGETLNDRLERAHGPLPQEEALSYARDLLDALDYAHQKGIIHRDVKPANVLLDSQGHACLTDFGIALLVGQQRLTRTGTSIGTPHYMSPEQIRNPKRLDHRADVYSVGCMIYEMLAGRPPFLPESEDGDTDFELKEAHMYHQPEPIRRWNPAVPAALDAAVLRALAKDPDQRYGGCGEFRRALETWERASGPTPMHPPPPPKPPPQRAPVPPPIIPTPVPPPPVLVPPKPAPTSKSGLAIGLIVLLFVVLFIVYAATRKKDEEPAEETPAATTETTTMETSTTSEMTTDVTATPPSASGAPEPGDSRDLSLMHGSLDRAGGGLSKVGDYYDKLAPNTSDNLELGMQQGIPYRIAAVCNAYCHDIDLTLFDTDGTLLLKDTATNDTPVLEITPTRSGKFTLRVSMARCDTSICHYGVGLFREEEATTPPAGK